MSDAPTTLSRASQQNQQGTEQSQLYVIRRNGELTEFDPDRIYRAISKAFLAVEGEQASDSKRIHDLAQQFTDQITRTFMARRPHGGTIHIENVQDQVELSLIRGDLYQVARAYILYREKRQQQRQAEAAQQPAEQSRMNITLDDGTKKPLNETWLRRLVSEASQGLTNVDEDYLFEGTLQNLFEGASVPDIYKALVMTARSQVEKDPEYSYAAARLLLNELRREALEYYGFDLDVDHATFCQRYPDYFKAYIKQGIDLEMLDSRLWDFDHDKLGNALQGGRDLQFTHHGLQTLYDRYFLHDNEIRFELPQLFFMRVAMGLAINESENDKTERAIEFYDLLSSFDYMTSTPTLFNSGTRRPQLSSCFLTTIPDHLDGIYSAIRDNALLSKFAGGLGNDWTPVRAMGAHIKGTNGKSQGVVPFMNVVDASAVAVNQGGKRKGAICGYLETWHMDVEEFLELRKNTGDDRRRTHDMNTANWVPDLFMKRVFENDNWTLFSPDEVPELHDLYGLEFEKAYKAYEEKAARGEIRSKTVSAVQLWRKMLSLLFETGHPWITFKDPSNLRSPQQHAGVVHSSNLCTEITLNTSEDEIAVCNLGSINMAAHMKNGKLDTDKLSRTVKTAVRMLDNVIDINYYTVPQAERANMRHRPVGLGLMGFQDALYEQRIPYASQQAVEFADECMEHISYHAIRASSDLAAERGSYESFDGSLWSKGVLPIDSIEYLKQARGDYLEQDTTARLDWDSVRNKVQQDGMRNSNVMAIAPTATIANICGVSQSIEPTYQNLFVKSNMSGEFVVINPYLVEDLKARGLWDNVMANDLKYYNGSIQNIDRIPDDLKDLYATAFEITPKWLVEAASRRQKWIDQSQSLNLYMAEPSGRKLDVLYRMAWLRGLKTTYYLRSMGATEVEKATVPKQRDTSADNSSQSQACSIDDEGCEACE